MVLSNVTNIERIGFCAVFLFRFWHVPITTRVVPDVWNETKLSDCQRVRWENENVCMAAHLCEFRCYHFFLFTQNRTEYIESKTSRWEESSISIPQSFRYVDDEINSKGIKLDYGILYGNFSMKKSKEHFSIERNTPAKAVFIAITNCTSICKWNSNRLLFSWQLRF